MSWARKVAPRFKFGSSNTHHVGRDGDDDDDDDDDKDDDLDNVLHPWLSDLTITVNKGLFNAING